MPAVMRNLSRQRGARLGSSCPWDRIPLQRRLQILFPLRYFPIWYCLAFSVDRFCVTGLLSMRPDDFAHGSFAAALDVLFKLWSEFL